MYFQPTGRNQRPRGFHIKRGFQYTSILVICFWLLYQIKHSNDKKGDRSLQAEFGEGNSVVILGRKGDVELKDKSKFKSDSKDVILELDSQEKDRGGGEDELDIKVDENGSRKMEQGRKYHLSTNSESVEIEMRDKDNEVFSEDNSQGLENSNRIISNLDGGGYEKDQKRQIVSDERRQRSSANGLVQLGDDKGLERQTKELQRNEEIRIDALKPGKEEETNSSKENGDKDLRGKEVNGTENSAILGLHEVAKGIHGFHDENGVPQGGNDLVEFALVNSRDGQQKGNQETISSLNHQSKIINSERNTTDVENTRSKQQTSVER